MLIVEQPKNMANPKVKTTRVHFKKYVIYHWGFEGNYYECNSCGEERIWQHIDLEKHKTRFKFCPGCGLLIDWD